MFGTGVSVWGSDFRITRKCLVIFQGNCPSCFDIFIKMREFNIQYGSLNGIQPAVTSHHIMIITLALPVVGYHLQFYCQVIVIGKNGTAVSVTSQVFTGEKRGSTNIAYSTGFFNGTIGKTKICTNSLSVVFYYEQVMLSGDIHDVFHVCGLSV